jgi:hypothetical protein
MADADPTGYLCEQCLDAPAVAFVAAPWGGRDGRLCGLRGPRARGTRPAAGRGARLPHLRSTTRSGRGRDGLCAALHG